jgi:hypothetical protein
MYMTTLKGMLGVAAVLAVAGAANAALTITGLGTGAPPTQYDKPGFGMQPLTAAMDDTSPVFGDVSSAPLGPGKNVLFSIPLSHRQIGSGWATWSHGYTGDVYYTNGASSVTLTFDQKDMQAFYFYVEPNFFGLHPFSITANGGGASQTVTAMVEGSAGAQGFLVVADKIDSIVIDLTDFTDFAVGEFGYAKSIPAPGALALLGLAGLAGRRRRA